MSSTNFQHLLIARKGQGKKKTVVELHKTLKNIFAHLRIQCNCAFLQWGLLTAWFMAAHYEKGEIVSCQLIMFMPGVKCAPGPRRRWGDADSRPIPVPAAWTPAQLCERALPGAVQVSSPSATYHTHSRSKSKSMNIRIHLQRGSYVSVTPGYKLFPPLHCITQHIGNQRDTSKQVQNIYYRSPVRKGLNSCMVVS